MQNYLLADTDNANRRTLEDGHLCIVLEVFNAGSVHQES